MLLLIEFEEVETGLRGEVYRQDDPPLKIGEEFEFEGRRVRRLPPTLAGSLVEVDPRHISDFHPPGWEAHRRAGGKFEKGPLKRCIFETRTQIERTAAAARHMGEDVAYDRRFGRAL